MLLRRNRACRMWRLNPVICGYHSLEPYHWCLGILHISLTGAMIPVIADAWLNCSVSSWWWRSLFAAGSVRNVCWIVPSCVCISVSSVSCLNSLFSWLVTCWWPCVCVGEGPRSRVSAPSPWSSLGEDVFASWSHCSSEKVFLREDEVERSLW